MGRFVLAATGVAFLAVAGNSADPTTIAILMFSAGVSLTAAATLR